MTDLSKKYQMDIGKIKYRVNLYQMHGELPFSDEYEKRIYTREEKINAIKIVLSGQKCQLRLQAEGLSTLNNLISLLIFLKNIATI